MLPSTTDVDNSIFDLQAHDLAQVRASEPARFGNRFADVGIPTLAQAAQLLAAFPAAVAFVDMQAASLQQHGNKIVLVASDLRTVDCIRQRGGYRTGWILAEYTPLSALKCEAIRPDFLFCDQRHLPRDASRLWRGPWRWIISDVATGTQAMQLATRGASFVQTTAVRSLLRELRHLTSRRSN